jgi:hypothetical protein
MTLAFTPAPHTPLAPASEGRAGDRYLLALGACLLGYALLGRAFAYVGVPPVFIGEVMLAVGLALTIRLRGLDRLGRVGPFWVLFALQALTVVRSVPYVGEYGLDVARDAMLFGYGFYAVVVFLLVTERPERLRALVLRYRTFATVMVALVWLPYLAYRINETWIPLVPGQDNVRLVEAKGGDLMVHLSGIGAFLLLGLRRMSWPITLGLAVTAILVMISNRGGMIAFVLALGLAVALRPPGASGARMAFALVAVIVAGIVAVPVMESVRISGNSRALTVEQIWDNVKSVVGQSDSNTLETTKTWRLAWWKKIIDDTALGDKFWTGRGFGLNFADYDGFAVDDEGSLRSPHNATMTVLGRLGVPGLVLWLILHAWWVFLMLRAWFAARVARRDTWSAVFAFALCLWVALVVNSSFEVYFEGPMGGIWLWTVIGAGLAGVTVWRRHPDLFSTPDFGSPPTRRVPPQGPDAAVLAQVQAAIAATPWTAPDGAALTRSSPVPAPVPAAARAPRAPASWADAPTPWDAARRAPDRLDETARRPSPPAWASAAAWVPPEAAPPAFVPLTDTAPSGAVPPSAPPRPPVARGAAPPPAPRPTDALWEWSPAAAAWRSS